MPVEIRDDVDGTRLAVLSPPVSDADVRKLRTGDRVRVTGEIYTARDAAHARLAELDEQGEPWPFPAHDAVIYYTGPTPARPDHIVGSAGPTTASRMDPYLRMTLDHGVRVTIGKGGRGDEARRALADAGGAYLAAVGGLGAVLARAITSSEVVAFDDLGTEAIRRLDVVDFPAVVVYDVEGGDLYSSAQESWKRSDSGA